MSLTIRNQLKEVRKLYNKISRNSQKISELEQQLTSAEAAKSGHAPKGDYVEGAFVAKEKQRQEEAYNIEKASREKKIEKKVRGVFIVLALAVLIFIYSILDIHDDMFLAEFLARLIVACCYSIVPVIILFFLNSRVAIFFCSILIPKFKLNIEGIRAAEEEDRKAKEVYLRLDKEYRKQCVAEYTALSKAIPGKIQVLREENIDLDQKAHTIMLLPEEYDSLSGVEFLLECYDSCCTEWCNGGDPEDIKILIRYCKSVKKDAKEKRIRQQRLQYEATLRRREQQDREAAYAAERFRTAQAAEREAEARERYEKALSDLEDKLDN